ncbi:MAG: hypothetical protein IJ647_10375 [Prevotella sp.]|nr:hypothetical protein [Prevotella sp.]
MNKKKSLYEAPTTDVLVVRFEEGVLTGSPVAGQAGANETYNFYDEDF